LQTWIAGGGRWELDCVYRADSKPRIVMPDVRIWERGFDAPVIRENIGRHGGRVREAERSRKTLVRRVNFGADDDSATGQDTRSDGKGHADGEANQDTKRSASENHSNDAQAGGAKGDADADFAGFWATLQAVMPYSPMAASASDERCCANVVAQAWAASGVAPVADAAAGRDTGLPLSAASPRR
jgi:hypothetical protein